MIAAIIVILAILWFLGYVRLDVLPIPDITLFVLNGHNISLWDMLIFLVVVWAIGILPNPLRAIAGVLLILWVLSLLGILAIANLSSMLVLAIIVGLIASLFL